MELILQNHNQNAKFIKGILENPRMLTTPKDNQKVKKLKNEQDRDFLIFFLLLEVTLSPWGEHGMSHVHDKCLL